MVTVRLQVPFESLMQAVTCLDLDDKRKLVEMLEDQIFEEEDLMVNTPAVSTEPEAENVYQADDYETIEEYIASRSRQIS